MSNPLSYPNLLIEVAKLQKDVRELMRRRYAAGATNVDELEDAEAKYLHATEAPQQDAAFRWDATRDVPKFGGLATFRDPEVVSFYDTWEITTWGGITANYLGPTAAGVPLVDGTWDVTRPCLVTVAQFPADSWTRMEVDPATTPPTYEDPPVLVLGLYDGDSGRVTTPGADYELAGDRMSMTPGLGAGQSASWLFRRGRPFVQAASFLSERAADGLTLPMTVHVFGRVTRL